MPTALPGEGPDILHGWKEIAAHLGRSVRSAQRWEATLRLPVKRISTPDGGQIIYASRVEIDEWQRQTAVRDETDDQLGAVGSDGQDDKDAEHHGLQSPLEPSAATDEIPTAAANDPPPAMRRVVGAAGPRMARAMLVLVTLVAGMFAGVWLVTSAVPAWSTPTEFAVEGSAVIARNASGRPVWTYALGQSAHRPPDLQVGSGAVTGDLDGDGTMEVALPVALAPARAVPATTDMVLVFEKSGRLRWKIQPTLRVFDGGTAFDGPWRLQALAFSSAPPGRLWIAYGHHTWHPAFVLEVSSRGAQSVRYLMSGRTFALAHWRTSTLDYLAAGGIDRQQQAASITLLDLNGPAARWPLDGKVLTCERCPTGPPRALALFPTSDVSRADFRSSGWVYAMHPTSPDRLTMTMTNGTGPVGPDTTAVMQSDLTIAELARTEEHWATHRAFEAAGRIQHAVDACPEAALPVVVRRWTRESGWADQAVPSAARPLSRLASGPHAR